MPILTEINTSHLGFLDQLFQEISECKKPAQPNPIDVTNLSLEEVISCADHAIWNYVPTPGVKRTIIDFNFATKNQIKEWLTTNYSLFYFQK
jgi:hypothetical protein